MGSVWNNFPLKQNLLLHIGELPQMSWFSSAPLLPSKGFKSYQIADMES